MKKIFFLLTGVVVSTLTSCSIESSLSGEPTICENYSVDTSHIPERSYNIVGTNQFELYNNVASVEQLNENDDFYGQDASYDHLEPLYFDHCDGTITDLNTGLMWTQTTDINGDGVMNANDKLTPEEAVDNLKEFNLGGYEDWRIPTIKELYSLILFSGTDASGYEEDDSSVLKPFIDEGYFQHFYGLTNEGERLIDSQYLSSTVYVDTDNYDVLTFGVNFADGRIKGYGARQMGVGEKTFSIIYVRGNQTYGVNDFQDNGDGTIRDHATGLMWMQQGSSDTYDWQDALGFAENSTFRGYTDWRLPTIKELQSIVDYTKSPDTSNSPAIDDLFSLASFTNENNELDWGSYWSSTTHVNFVNGPTNAAYISFGRSLGFMGGDWIDVHGAGAQRSDPKTGNPSDYPRGFGPQGDAIRIFNYVLLVRREK